MTLFVSEAFCRKSLKICFAKLCSGGRGNCGVVRLPAFDRYDVPVASHRYAVVLSLRENILSGSLLCR